MTFTGRIRTWLIIVAVAPTLIVLSVIYFLGQRQASSAERVAAQRGLDRFAHFHAAYTGELTTAVRDAAASSDVARALLLLDADRPADVRIGSIPANLDFLEILDTNYTVLASHHRPGLIGEVLTKMREQPDAAGLVATVEIDISGSHAAIGHIVPVGEKYAVYAGKYLDSSYLSSVERLIAANARIDFAEDAPALLDNMSPERLYTDGDSLRAVLIGAGEDGYYLSAAFTAGPATAIFGNLLLITGVVALVSVLVAVALGIYIAGRAKREFDNLISATARVSSGDFSTPVMAYDEGEFAQLADSFTEMTFRLKDVQRRLATSEKIAAWQAVGRKIAHEIKNPLTPIAISTDDLRRSYHEQLPDFPAILDETTTTIKSEVTRLTRLLDEFVRFARMSPPIFRDVAPKDLLPPLESLYRAEVAARRLTLTNAGTLQSVNLDPDALQQVLVNLIKNGLEAGPVSCVTVTLSDEADLLVLTVADTGPGFPGDILTRGFEPYVSTKKGGSGLGLVICQRIVYDHGGTVELSNRPEGGAQVTIKLPVSHG